MVGHADREAARAAIALEPVGRRIVRRHISEGRQDCREVRHRSAAHEQPAARCRIPDELRDPCNRPSLDFCGGGSGLPRADVHVHGGGEGLREDADHRAGPVHEAEVPRGAEMGRVREDAPGPSVENRGRVTAFRGKGFVECRCDLRRRAAREHGNVADRSIVIGDRVNDTVAELAECFRVEVQVCEGSLC